MRPLLAFLAALVLAAPATAASDKAEPAGPERFRLVNRVHGDEVRWEWNEITPDSITSAVDAAGGMRMWEFVIIPDAPLQSGRIEARVFSLREALDHPVAIRTAEHVGGELRRTYTDLAGGKPPVVTSEPWPENAIFLPRGLLGYELVIRYAMAHDLKNMHFTWLDPLYATEQGSLEFVDKQIVHFRFADTGDAVDELKVDGKGKITGGKMGLGGTLRRDKWLPMAERKRDPKFVPKP